jgi:hypothetical protein
MKCGVGSGGEGGLAEKILTESLTRYCGITYAKVVIVNSYVLLLGEGAS